MPHREQITRREDHAPSVRRQLALLLAFAIAPALLLAIAFGARSYAVQTAESEREFLRDTVSEARSVRDVMAGARATLRTLAAGADLADFGAPGCNRVLTAAVDRDPAFAIAIAMDDKAEVRCASAPAARRLSLGLDGRMGALMEGPEPRLDFVRLGEPDDPDGSRPAAAASFPLSGAQGPRGVVALLAPVSSLRVRPQGEGSETEGEPESERRAATRTAVVDSSGMVMLDGAEAGRGWLPTVEDIRPLLAREAGLAQAVAAAGEDWVYAAAPLWQGRAWLLSGVPAQTLHAPAMSRAAAPIIAPVLMLLVAVSMAYFGINRLVVRHVVYLARLTRAYGRGRLGLRPRGLENAPWELAVLAEDMALMAERLNDRETALRSAAESNRFLLREVHHRVKNNLQMIVSLLNLQMGRAGPGPERDALDRIRARVLAVAAVHGSIYAAERLDRVPLAPLIERVARPLAEMTPPGGRAPELVLELDDLEEIPDRATPLALLINEAMTNAVKYGAAAGGAAPRIAITLAARADGGYRLTVCNDVDASPAAPRPEDVGSRLIEGFVRQLGARMERETRDGRFTLSVTAPPPPEPPQTGLPEPDPDPEPDPEAGAEAGRRGGRRA